MSRAWPGRPPWRHVGAAIPAPVVPLAGGNVDDWLASRSSNFRQQMRRSRRKLEKAGAVFRVASTPEEIDRDLAEFRRLHEARWEWRGGSSAFPPGTDKLLRDAGRELVDGGRFQLISIELDGRVINSQLFVAAGGEVSYWNGGFDDEFGSYKPSLVGLVEAIRLSIAGGLTRFDLGPGAQEYKNRFADDHDELLWQTLIPRGHRRYALARLLYAPRQVRRAVAVRLTPEQKARIRGMLRRGGAE